MTTQTNNSNQKSLRNVWWFVGISLVCSVVAWFTMNTANKRMEATHAIIISHQQKSIESTDSLLAIYRKLANDSDNSINFKILEQINNQLLNITQGFSNNDNGERIINLLESELSKIQTEYEVLNLWCALLTVVFLIFSFFSIFKANEMATQSEDALKSMRDIEKEVQAKSESIDKKITEADGKISKITQKIATLDSQQQDLSIKYNTLKDTEIPAINSQIKDSHNSVSNLQKLIADAEKRLNDLYNDKAADLKLIIESILAETQFKIEDMASQSFNKNHEQFLHRLDQTDISLKEILKTLQELTTDDFNQEELDAETDEENIIEDDDEDEPLNTSDDTNHNNQ